MADTERDSGLEERLARLEAVVARLVEQVEGGRAALSSEAPGAPPREERPGPPRGPDGLPRFEWAQRPADAAGATGGAGAAGRSGNASGASGAASSTSSATSSEAAGGGAWSRGGAEADHLAASGERWLGRVGVAFVVLAFGFLFKYAFDQGWIGPAFRLVLGFLAATAMLVVGLRLEGERERYSQYLLGGSIALYYLVGYASYVLYALLPFALAFALMAATTVLAFVLAERQRLASLAVIGAAGGLATPFLVSTGSGNVPALAAYTTLLLAGAGTLQFWRGWRVLLLVLGLGGLAVTGAATAMADGFLERGSAAVAVLAVWVLWGALPLLRAELRRSEPGLWPDPVGDADADGSTRDASPEGVDVVALLRLGCWVATLVALLQLGQLLGASRAGHAPLFAAAAAIYVVLAWRFFATRTALNTAAEVASGLLAIALVLWFFDARAFLPLAVLACAMHLADARWSQRGVGILAHGLFAVLAGSFLARAAVLGGSGTLGIQADGSPFGILELTILGTIALAALISLELASRAHRSIYLLGAHIAFMVWLAYQLSPLELGQELISLTWGAYGIVLLLLAVQRGQRDVQLVALATLGVVALKLLVVDMAQVDVIWRILLFMGFGAAFLGLSYMINRRPAKG